MHTSPSPDSVSSTHAVAIIPVAGLASRLGSQLVTKPLQTIYSQPAIFHQVSLAFQAGVRHLVVVVSEQNRLLISDLLGDGSQFGAQIEYVQTCQPNGPMGVFRETDVIRLCEESRRIMLILDGFFFDGTGQFEEMLQRNAGRTDAGATLLAATVPDPRPFGLIVRDVDGRISGFQEKPTTSPMPGRLYDVCTHVHFFDVSLCQKVAELQSACDLPSVHRAYSDEDALSIEYLPQGTVWHDLGTVEELLQTGNDAKALEDRGCLPGYPHIWALRRAWITPAAYRKTRIGQQAANPYNRKVERWIQQHS